MMNAMRAAVAPTIVVLAVPAAPPARAARSSNNSNNYDINGAAIAAGSMLGDVSSGRHFNFNRS